MKTDIVQLKNPRSNRYIKIDRARGRILSHKKSEGAYKGISIARKRILNKKGKTMTRIAYTINSKSPYYSQKETGKYYITAFTQKGAEVYRHRTEDDSKVRYGVFNAHEFGKTFLFNGWTEIDFPNE